MRNAPRPRERGLSDCEIAWVPKGVRFYIDEYDGSETLVIIGPDYGFVA